MKKNKSFLKWLKQRPDGQAFLFSTQDEFSHEDYLEWCEINGIESPGDEDSLEFHEWCRDTARVNYEEDLNNCRHSENLRRRFVVAGTLGLWWGRPTIEAVICEDFDTMVKKVVSKDILDVEAKYDTHCIHITCGHHDGENAFDVYLIKPTTDTEMLQSRIDNGKFDPEGYDRRFLEKITDYIV